MICGCTFSVSKRRHHCRSCGDAVCGSCSKFKKVLPDFNLLGGVKVCTFCNTENTVYRESKLLGAWGEMVWRSPSVRNTVKSSPIGKDKSNGSSSNIGAATTAAAAAGGGDNGVIASSSSSPNKVVTFRETTSLIPLNYEEVDLDRNSAVYDNEDTINQVIVEDGVQSSSEISCQEAINAEDIQTTTSSTTTTTTTTREPVSAVGDVPVSIPTTTATAGASVDGTGGQTQSHGGGDELSSIHDDENSESADLSQTFDGMLDLNSPGIASTSRSIDSGDAKDFNINTEGDKSPAIGNYI